MPVALLKLRTYRAVSQIDLCDDLLSQEDPNIPPICIYRNTTMTHEVATIADSHEIPDNYDVIPRAIIVITWSSEKKTPIFSCPRLQCRVRGTHFEAVAKIKHDFPKKMKDTITNTSSNICGYSFDGLPKHPIGSRDETTPSDQPINQQPTHPHLEELIDGWTPAPNNGRLAAPGLHRASK